MIRVSTEAEPGVGTESHGHLPCPHGRVRRQLKQVAAQPGAPGGRIYRECRRLPGTRGRQRRGGNLRQPHPLVEGSPGIHPLVVSGPPGSSPGPGHRGGRVPRRAYRAAASAPRQAPGRGCDRAAAAGRTGRRPARRPRGSTRQPSACTGPRRPGSCTAARSRRRPGSRSSPAEVASSAISGGSSPSSSAAAWPSRAEIAVSTRSHSSSVNRRTRILTSYGAVIRPCTWARASPGASVSSPTAPLRA